MSDVVACRPRWRDGRMGHDGPMKNALTVNDFLRRAEEVYPDRTAVIDEPTQPAESWGEITYADMAARGRAWAAWLDRHHIGVGERLGFLLDLGIAQSRLEHPEGPCSDGLAGQHGRFEFVGDALLEAHVSEAWSLRS